MPEDVKNSSATKVYSPASADVLKTASYGAQTDSRTDRTSTHNLGVGDSVTLAGADYRIERIISGENKSGEALIYLIRDNNSNDYAFKLYYPFRDPRDEPNSEALKRIKDINNPDILKLHQFGIGAEKFNGQFCYEICDYANGGDLLNVDNIKEKYTPEFIERHVIKEIFKGIQVLHENRIYHCDLKPHNVFYLDENQKDLVIGDYGSAKTFEQSSEKELSYMSVVKGTDFYLAPEQAIGIISEKNDYYSFGMIILHLLYPEKIDQQTLRKIYERRAAEKPIIDYDTKYKRLNDLIAGLTLQDIQQRWGLKEVSQWLSGKTVPVNYQKAVTYAVAPINVGKTSIQTEDELIAYVQKGDEWYRYLIEDEQGYNLLLTWISQHQNLESKQQFDKLIRIAGRHDKRFVREALIRYFRPDRPVRVITDLNVFDTDDPEKTAADFVAQLEDQWKIVKLTDMTWHLFCFGMAMEQYAMTASDEKQNSAGAVLKRFLKCFRSDQTKKLNKEEVIRKRKESASKTSPKSEPMKEWELISREITDECIIQLFYEFNSGRSFRDLAGKSYSTLAEVALSFAANPGLWDERILKTERQYFLNKISRTDLAKKERNDFLLNVFQDQIRWVIGIDEMTPMVESDRVVLKYIISGSLTDFFHDQGIKEELNAKPKTGSVSLFDFSKKEADALCSETLIFIEKEHGMSEKKWSLTSLEQLQKEIVLYQKTFIRDVRNQQHRKLRADIMQSVRSFFILLPVIALYLLYLGCIQKNHEIIRFLSGLLPFTFDVSSLGLSETTSFSMAGNMSILMLVSILPSWIMCRGILGWIFGFSIAHVTLIAVWFYSPVIMVALSLIANSAALYLIQSSRVRIIPFLASVVPVLLIIFIADVIFKDTLPSAKVMNPMNAAVFIRNGSLTEEQPVFMRIGISDDEPIVGRIIDKDSITIIDEKQGWYLVRNQGAEGFAQVDKIGLPGYLKTSGTRPSPEVLYPMNILVSPKSNESLIRSGKSEAYAIIGSLPQNQSATVISKDSNWFLVRHQNTEGYLKISDVNETVIKKGRLINRNPVLRKEPSSSSKSLRNRWYGTLNIYAEHDGWYLIRSYYGEYGYIPQGDVRIIRQ